MLYVVVLLGHMSLKFKFRVEYHFLAKKKGEKEKKK